ncbi:MAG: hypothetical protein ACSW8B_01955, partial [bacterium]
MNIEKTIKSYAKIYRKALIRGKMPNETDAYERRLRDMYMSEEFKNHSRYPTTNAVHVYAVIAMCLELKRFNLSDSQ